MTIALPTTTEPFSTSATEAEFKTFISSQREYISQMLGSSGASKDAKIALKTIFHSSTLLSSAYSVDSTDCGSVLKCTGSWVLSFASAATLGDGFYVQVINAGSGSITADPNGSEIIDGSTTKVISSGSSLTIYCDGVELFVVGGAGSAEDISSALGYVPASSSMEHGAVGSLCFAYNTSNAVILPGATVAGSSLRAVSVITSGGTTVELVVHATALSGTWRCLGYAYYSAVSRGATLFQRIS